MVLRRNCRINPHVAESRDKGARGKHDHLHDEFAIKNFPFANIRSPVYYYDNCLFMMENYRVVKTKCAETKFIRFRP